MMTDSPYPDEKIRHKKVYEANYSYDEIARELGISRVAVQQIEKRALRKVAKALVLLGYLKEDFI